MQPSIRSLALAGVFVASASIPVRAQCLEWDARFFTAGANDLVRASAVFDDGSGPALYVGGAFETVGEVEAASIAKWDGASWSSVGEGTNFEVITLAVLDDGSGPALYAGGKFTQAGGMSANHVAKWDGSSWSALGSGINGDVYGLATFDDGGGPALYAAGVFSTAGGASANHVAKWNGSTWSPLGSGITGGDLSSIAVYDDGSGAALHVGGNFTAAGGVSALRIAKWDGTTWSALGAGMAGNQAATQVRALIAHDDGSGPALYAGGLFVTAGGVNVNNVARWDGATWSSLAGGTSDEVWALAVHNEGSGNALFAGGEFQSAGGTSASRVARWNGASWTALASGTSDLVRTLVSFDGGGGSGLVAGGGFASAGDVHVGRIATWDGASWARIGDCGQGVYGTDSSIFALTVFDDGTGPAMYAGGVMSNVGCVAANTVARWNGSEWEALDIGLSGYVLAFAIFDDGTGAALYAGGRFPDGSSLRHIVKWDGSTWTGLATDLNGDPRALAVHDDGSGPALYAAGNISSAGGVGVNHIARWDGTSWSAVGSGIPGTNTLLNTLVVFDDGAGPALYAGGDFDNGGGMLNIARWDGANWSSVGGGVGTAFNSNAQALAVFDDGSGPALYVGGNFASAGGVPARGVAKWDGSSWSPLGSGTNSSVSTLAVFDDGSGAALYAGGSFTTAGGPHALRIAKWDGSSWSPLGAGVSTKTGFESVGELVVFDDGADGAPDLYAGGFFTTAGGSPSSMIAEWHGCEPGAPYCFGDGLEPVQTVECPCGNVGDPGHGCLGFPPSLGGARLLASGSVNPNTIVLECEDVPNNTLCTFIRSFNNNAVGLVFGDGVRCVNPPLFRFGQQMSGQMGNAPFTIAVPAPTEIPGSTVRYLVQYRNPNGGWCLPALFNASNGYTISW